MRMHVDDDRLRESRWGVGFRCLPEHHDGEWHVIHCMRHKDGLHELVAIRWDYDRLIESGTRLGNGRMSYTAILHTYSCSHTYLLQVLR